MRIIVTGGAGFIGSHIVDALVEQGHRVLVIDNCSTGFKRNVNSKALFVKADVCSSTGSRRIRAFKSQAVFHYAAQISVNRSVEDPFEDARVNVLGTIRVAEAAARAGARLLVFASSGGTLYGDAKQWPIDEHAPVNPSSPYAVAKLAAEHYSRVIAESAGMRWVCLRLANVYGPRQNSQSEAGVVAIFTSQLLGGRTPTINGTGRQTRDFVFVEDVVRANLAALRFPTKGIFNIGTGKETSVYHIYRLLAEAIGSRVTPQYGPPKPGEVRRNALRCRRAATVLQWQPRVAIEQGIRRTVGWFQKE